jgi:excisionase family DNA binding protein
MSTATDQREYLKPQEVADELGFHVSAVYRSIERGELQAIRLTPRGAIRVPRSAIEPGRSKQ